MKLSIKKVNASESNFTQYTMQLIGKPSDANIIENIEESINSVLTGYSVFSKYHDCHVDETYGMLSDNCAEYEDGRGCIYTIDEDYAYALEDLFKAEIKKLKGK